ncbi:hypothetical protein GWI33_002920 [Rhynchophorus ferrugineus]|uniref:Uncharacterized protein n=1 Tax=Rhynchophorus ferrugineus TaxID=354439 RepID=A0A834MG45_RHYFE|nr:hypothetical protein GWI33_002920 [Rhynchophorus ferrugineus]
MEKDLRFYHRKNLFEIPTRDDTTCICQRFGHTAFRTRPRGSRSRIHRFDPPVHHHGSRFAADGSRSVSVFTPTMEAGYGGV